MYEFRMIIRYLIQNSFNSSGKVEKLTNFYNGWIWAYTVLCWKTNEKLDLEIIKEKNTLCKKFLESIYYDRNTEYWQTKVDKMMEKDFGLISKVFELLKEAQPSEFIESLTRIRKYKGAFAVEKQGL